MPPSATHKNDNKKKKGKGPQTAAAAVCPVQTVQPQVQQKMVDDETPPLVLPSKIEREPVKMPTTASVNPIRIVPSTKPSIQVCRGQLAKPQPVHNTGVVSTVADMIHSTIPISSSNLSDLPEKIEWVELQRCETAESSKFVDLLVIGLARGFQIWILNEDSHWEEVLSERQGPIRLGKLLPQNPVQLNENDKDVLGPQRPLFAIVDASSPNLDKQFCTLTLLSLSTAQKMNKFTFDEPISAIQTSNKFTALGLSTVIVVLDSFSLHERFRVPMTTPSEGFAPAISLCSSFLAYAHAKPEQAELSCGGLDLEQKETQSTMTGQMLQAISRTMTTLNESVSGATARVVGYVGVVDLLTPSPSSLNSPNVIARFLAHQSSVAHISFSPDGRCLATADESGNSFHVFLILPHPVTVSLGTVQHLYRLHRGNTPAKLISSCWSLDGRWLTVATNHGTSHIFAICPYGGVPSYRSHSGKLANKESRFLRSAGLTEEPVITPTAQLRERRHSGSPLTYKKHAAQDKGSIAKAALNPRVGPYPAPITLNTVKKIRESTLSADKISAWASDLAPVGLTSSSGRKMGMPSSSRLSVLLSSNLIYIARADGIVCSYELRLPRAASPEDLPKLEMLPIATWTLTRTKKGDDVRAPLAKESTLMSVLYDENSEVKRKISMEGRDWIPEVEVHAYSGPHRRLWQGPQFSFYCYNEERSPNLVAPAQKCVPIVMGGGMMRGEDLMDATRIECGSWSSEKEVHGVVDEMDDIQRAITEAMKDVHVESEDTRVSDDEFFDTASVGGTRNDKKEDREDLLQFDDDF